MNTTRWILRAVAACLFALTGGVDAADPSPPVDALGPWHGSVQTPSGSMALELNIHRSPSGSLASTLESVDQAPGELIPVSSTLIEDGHL